MRTRTDNFGILTIVISVIASVWLFGFADDVFSAFQMNFDEIPDNLFYQKPNIKESQTTKSIVQENIVENIQAVVDTYESKVVEERKESSGLSESIPNESLTKNDDKIKKIIEEPFEKKIQRLEKQSYVLSGEGSGYEGAAHLSEYAKMSLKLRPVPDTNLSEFSITQGTLEIGSITFVIKGGSVILEKDSITIDIEHNDHRDPYLNMEGTINGSILDEKPLFATFEDQRLGLMKQDPTPIHLSLELELNSQK